LWESRRNNARNSEDYPVIFDCEARPFLAFAFTGKIFHDPTGQHVERKTKDSLAHEGNHLVAAQ
jgi:hypothetical protein